jgi:uncharacterized membrane protein
MSRDRLLETSLARGLGLFSLGLGAVQLLAPARFSRWVGVRPGAASQTVTRAVGLRELTAAAGLLSRPRPVAFTWSRVVGDLMDVALLSRAAAAPTARRSRVAAILVATAGITLLDLISSSLLSLASSAPREERRGSKRLVRRSITVNKPVEEAYAFWRDLENLPRFMQHLESVEVIDDRRSRWRAKGPIGPDVEWQAEITDERPNDRLAWRSIDGTGLANSGEVRFIPAPGDHGTEVHVEIEYEVPFGAAGVALSRLAMEEPGRQAEDDLRRFKQVLETGSVVWSEATIGDRKLRQRPAEPPDDESFVPAPQIGADGRYPAATYS